MKKTVLLILILSVMLLTSCSPSATVTPNPAPDLSQLVIDADEVNVLIQELALDPAEIVIHAGTQVTWFNLDAARHTVTANAGEFESPILLFGDTFSFTFQDVGEYPYSNKYHPDIKGKVIVVP